MNPNSAHQTWSRWTAIIEVPFHGSHVMPLFESEMKRVTARFYRKLFGSATELRITRDSNIHGNTKFTVECRTEGAPAQDMEFRRRRMDEIAKFFGTNLYSYGDVNVHVDVLIEAGDPGTGKPPSQLIIAPTISLDPGSEPATRGPKVFPSTKKEKIS